MGLTYDSIDARAFKSNSGMSIEKKSGIHQIIALAGNPNVGKSTVFNQLTGLNQHTGNWPGKTVSNARGGYMFKGRNNILVDIPGTYSLMAHSFEEETARDFICFGNADAVVVVCDATCLERNLNLVLQTVEITENVIVCINLMDEAVKKQISIDFKKLEHSLGVKVVGTNAARGAGLNELMESIHNIKQDSHKENKIFVEYPPYIEKAVSMLEPVIAQRLGQGLNSRWVSLKLLDGDEIIMRALNDYYGFEITKDAMISHGIGQARSYLKEQGVSDELLKDAVISCIIHKAEEICAGCVSFNKANYNEGDRNIDRLLTSKWTGTPVMMALLSIVFWLTIAGANYPSQVISNALFWIQDRLLIFLNYAGTLEIISNVLIFGIYRVVAWVVAVMLPPMAIFFPLFTLLEDLGYLPRVAFNLDYYFKKCHACGKQALTMCMGFGCNAAGVVGCRIIDSPRERLIAIITNNFVPCNGRFPMLIAIITMFFVTGGSFVFQSLVSSVLLTCVIVLGILMTFVVSRALSGSILKGIPSSFTLELPPYRKPQIKKIIVRSLFDRTLFVLGRAAAVAAPAGLIIWLMANIFIGNASILAHCSGFLDPFAKAIGLDGVILMAFVLGFPANEIVIPIIIMAYLSKGSILELDNLAQLRALLVDNGWTWVTAICTMLFSIMHWPCSTTCLTIKKETQSLKWTAVSFLVPTVTGVTICFLFVNIVRLLGVV